MVKKKIDNRIRVMIENGVHLGHRTMFIIVGDKGRDQVFYFISIDLENIKCRSVFIEIIFIGADFVRHVNQINS